jgi:hypothetical protein
MNAQSHLQNTIARLAESQPDDLRLRDHLEGVALDLKFPDLTWFWGPLLYERNRVVFRSLILNNFSEFGFAFGQSKSIRWSDHADRLQRWLDKARANRDVTLVRRLLRWKYASRKGWGIDTQAWNKALVNDYRQATGPAARALVLDQYDDWFEIDEATAHAVRNRHAL